MNRGQKGKQEKQMEPVKSVGMGGEGEMRQGRTKIAY
jgi:hypothetical protein